MQHLVQRFVVLTVISCSKYSTTLQLRLLSIFSTFLLQQPPRIPQQPYVMQTCIIESCFDYEVKFSVQFGCYETSSCLVLQSSRVVDTCCVTVKVNCAEDQKSIYDGSEVSSSQRLSGSEVPLVLISDRSCGFSQKGLVSGQCRDARLENPSALSVKHMKVMCMCSSHQRALLHPSSLIDLHVVYAEGCAF